MSDRPLRNHSDLLAACASFGNRQSRFADYTFKEFPILTITASEPIDGVLSSRAVDALQAAARRFYALLKYGRPRRLRKREREEVRIAVKHLDNDTRLEIDFSRPMNAALRAADQWDERALLEELPKQQRLFADMPVTNREQEHEKEGPWRTVRESILKLIDGLPPTDRKHIVMFGMLLFAGVVSSGLYFKESFAHDLAAQDLSQRHQREMAELDNTTIVTHTGLRAERNDRVQALERELDEQARVARVLVSGEIDHPLLRFVAAETKKLQPAVLNLAPSHGWLNVNGFVLTDEQAAAFAKAARRQISRNKAAEKNGWHAVVQHFDDPLGS